MAHITYNHFNQRSVPSPSEERVPSGSLLTWVAETLLQCWTHHVAWGRGCDSNLIRVREQAPFSPLLYVGRGGAICDYSSVVSSDSGAVGIGSVGIASIGSGSLTSGTGKTKKNPAKTAKLIVPAAKGTIRRANGSSG